MVLSSELLLPREAWDAHPNFPSQALLLNSHARFRRISQALVEQARSGHPIGAIAQTFRRWKSAMRGHESYEEHKLYPFLAVRWGISCDSMEAGHRELAIADRAVRRALQTAQKTGSSARLELTAALHSHDTILLRHLQKEESVVVPALLALRPDEFRAYSHGHIDTLLTRLQPVPHG